MIDRRAEGEGVSTAHEKEGDQTGDGEGLHHAGKDVLDAHHARVVEAKAWNRHHEHDGRADDHEGRVSGIERSKVKTSRLQVSARRFLHMVDRRGKRIDLGQELDEVALDGVEASRHLDEGKDLIWTGAR